MRQENSNFDNFYDATVSYDPAMFRKIVRRVPSSRKGGALRKIFWVTAFIAVAVFLGFTIRLYLSCRKIVDDHLKSQTWSLPSTIYADAPILYQGLPMKPERLVDYLLRLHYQPTPDKHTATGQFYAHGDTIIFQKRVLFYGASAEPAVLVRFKAGTIESIQNLSSNEELPAYELEPVPVSNLFGQEWEKRTLVQYEQIPVHLIRAVLAIEDRRFFSHGGLDFRGILRAIWNDLINHKQLQGGSTVTQQLVKNFYLTPERSIRRKINEAVMAWIMERRLRKEEILELYLNEIYLGQRGAMSINGIGEASLLYFGKDVQHVDVPEAALLAGMIQAPNIYNPYKHSKEAKTRRNVVLRAMKETNVISSSDYEKYVATELKVKPFDSRINLAPYFGNIVKTQLLEKYDQDLIYTKNLRVFTTLDPDMQAAAEESLAAGLEQIDKIRYSKVKKRVEGCLIAIEPQTGFIKALVGGRSYSLSQFDRVRQAKRQPGSIFKPVVYAAAFEEFFDKQRVFTPATLVTDEPWTLHFQNKTWQPKNYDGQYHGTVTLRTALAQSMNVATARLAMDVGLNQVSGLAKRLGFENIKPYPSLSLGSFEVSPWEVAEAYTVFANGGVRTEIRTLKKVSNTNGETLERSRIEVKKILHPQTAYLITDMLTTVLSSGTGAAVRQRGFMRPAAGKTGTTDEYRDAWFVGYTPNLLCVVWTGYDDNTPIKMTGAQAALPIWTRFMKIATQNIPVEDFSSPQGVNIKMIDPATGGLSTENCPSAQPELFIDGTEPSTTCSQHGKHWWKLFG